MPMLFRVEQRFIYPLPGDRRHCFLPVLEQCARENGGKVLGRPTIHLVDGDTELEVDESPWWREYMRVHGRELGRDLPPE